MTTNFHSTVLPLQRRVCRPDRFVKYLFILTWGGLRGAVGLVLALIISQDSHLSQLLEEQGRDKFYCQVCSWKRVALQGASGMQCVWVFYKVCLFGSHSKETYLHSKETY